MASTVLKTDVQRSRDYHERSHRQSEANDAQNRPSSRHSGLVGTISMPLEVSDRQPSRSADGLEMPNSDPYSPRNWPQSKKAGIVCVVSLLGCISPWASTVIAPAIEQISNDMGITNSTVSALVVSIFVAGYAVGQIFVNPLSEIFGRLPVQHCSIFGFLVFNIACAVSQTVAQLLVFRFLAGLAGSGLLSVGGGSIADMYNEEERGGKMALFVLAINVGPIFGPLVGGYLAQSAGWRWVLWLTVIMSSVVALISVAFLRETSHTIIMLKARRARLRQGSRHCDNSLLAAAATIHEGSATHRMARLVTDGDLVRPLRLLLKSPLLAILSVQLALVYGYLYLFFVTFSMTFTLSYHENPGAAGLNYLAFGIGTVLGLIVTGAMMDRIYEYLRKRREDGDGMPESRMPLVFPGSILVPIGLLLYGWTAQNRLLWIGPDVGAAAFAMGFMMVFMGIQLYIIDAFKYRNSAMGAANLLRCIAGAGLPLIGPKMFQSLSVGWGCSLLALIAIVLGIPGPVLIYLYGERIRRHQKDI